jgi:hypothetical protein
MGQVPPRVMKRSGRACGLTGRRWDEGTHRFLGRRACPIGALQSPPRWRSSLTKGLVQARGVCTSSGKCSRRRPERQHRQPKKVDKLPLTALLCLLTTGHLVRVRRIFDTDLTNGTALRERLTDPNREQGHQNQPKEDDNCARNAADGLAVRNGFPCSLAALGHYSGWDYLDSQ